MITGWVAVSALYGVVKPGSSAFADMLRLVAAEGTGQSLASALLLASGICAMMSTADSALLAFSTMWVRDLFKVSNYTGTANVTLCLSRVQTSRYQRCLVVLALADSP